MTLPPTADIVIIGAGAIGCSTAWHLAQAGVTDVVVVEMGQVGSGSSSKSASMLSLQFGRDETMARLAQHAYSCYMRFEEEIGVPIDFHPIGWLNLATAGEAEQLRREAAALQALGIATEVLEPDEIKRRYPLLNIEDIVVGTYGPDDGPFDPHMILWGYVKRASERGVRILQGVQATGVLTAGGRVTGVVTDAGVIATPLVVNAAGPWADQVARWTGVDLPLLNSARTILVTGPLPAVPADHPFVEDLSVEWYFRPEMEGVLMGMGKRPAPDLNSETPPEMIDAMIDAAVHRVPALDEASLLTAWTGIRPLTADGYPIVGAAPGIEGLLLNCGWGGVGIIMAPVAGQLLADLIIRGRSDLVNVERFSLRRAVAENINNLGGLNEGRVIPRRVDLDLDAPYQPSLFDDP